MIEIELCSTFVSQYKKGHLEYLITSDVPKEVILKVYKILVNEKQITIIENLAEEEKKKLVDECRETGLKFTNKSLTNAAKILHVLKFFNEKK
jgi:Mg/Co/Ni transporter MgtE